jgi:CubicO group peptidase (beta-lactamase class C family)
MSTVNHILKRILLKFLRLIAYIIVFVLIVGNLFILISGRTYLYKGIYHTYLQGKTGPGIFDKDVFDNSILTKSALGEPWKVSKVQRQLLPSEQIELEKLEISSFLVIQNDSILFEKYWGKHQPSTVTNSFSAAKTFVGLLIGCALKDQSIKSIDEPVGNYIPSFSVGKKSKITIRHLLMMSSGLDWEESGKNPLSDNAASYYGSDLYALVTKQEAIEEPGKRFEYQSGNSQLLGFIIEKATGKNLSAYADEKIWKQIGTENDAYWSLDKKNGDEKSFCCLYGTTRDFARLGKLIRDMGHWNGKEIIPTSYMAEFISNPPMSTEEGVNNYRYGLHIWTYLGGTDPVYYCRGILGQYIIAIPSKDLIIVRTGSIRGKNINLPAKYAHNQAYLEKYKYKFSHPLDLFLYLNIANRMIK